MFDSSGDGKIDASELQTILKAVNGEEMPLEEVEGMIGEFDDGDGEIELDEFLQLMAVQMN